MSHASYALSSQNNWTLPVTSYFNVPCWCQHSLGFEPELVYPFPLLFTYFNCLFSNSRSIFPSCLKASKMNTPVFHPMSLLLLDMHIFLFVYVHRLEWQSATKVRWIIRWCEFMYFLAKISLFASCSSEHRIQGRIQDVQCVRQSGKANLKL